MFNVPVHRGRSGFSMGQHGGYREGAGRKVDPDYGERFQVVSILLSKRHYKFLMRHPEGTSAAVRDLYEECRGVKFTPRKVPLDKPSIQSSISLPSVAKEDITKIGKGSFVSGLRVMIEFKLTGKR